MLLSLLELSQLIQAIFAQTLEFAERIFYFLEVRKEKLLEGLELVDVHTIQE